jgi:hypothetical protein
MTKNEQNRVVAWRLKILRQANDLPRGVAQTCRHFGPIFADVLCTRRNIVPYLEGRSYGGGATRPVGNSNSGSRRC